MEKAKGTAEKLILEEAGLSSLAALESAEIMASSKGILLGRILRAPTKAAVRRKARSMLAQMLGQFTEEFVAAVSVSVADCLEHMNQLSDEDVDEKAAVAMDFIVARDDIESLLYAFRQTWLGNDDLRDKLQEEVANNQRAAATVDTVAERIGLPVHLSKALAAVPAGKWSAHLQILAQSETNSWWLTPLVIPEDLRQSLLVFIDNQLVAAD